MKFQYLLIPADNIFFFGTLFSKFCVKGAIAFVHDFYKFMVVCDWITW